MSRKDKNPVCSIDDSLCADLTIPSNCHDSSELIRQNLSPGKTDSRVCSRITTASLNWMLNIDSISVFILNTPQAVIACQHWIAISSYLPRSDLKNL